jgi:PKD repeat protein
MGAKNFACGPRGIYQRVGSTWPVIFTFNTGECGQAFALFPTVSIEAAFSGTPLAGQPPLSVAFTDLSTG